MMTLLLIFALVGFMQSTYGFQPSSLITSRQSTVHSSTSLFDTATEVEENMKEQHGIFYNLILSKNKNVWKELSDPNAAGFTIFAPTDEAMESLGNKKLNQLVDDRNRETAEKIAEWHVVNEPVGAWDLITSGGVVTMGGTVDIGKSKVGGFLGFGGEEDGGVLVSGRKILESKQVDKVTIHVMDGLVSPDILWRYMDQLRIL
ncbi:hypothetical protein CTEN210_12247 [Chaetoceros tenuissimus]|uniref:FAS1 domain-containing protein n=1 Tax=Chaetoceros tenuissimus TaxID=426638 RepID=A0AAD3HA27_9STRA|nr:hypothetical protein CTEN210_12247 [Chaetoceros tenuissimus]